MTTHKKADARTDEAKLNTTPAVDRQGEAGAQARFDGEHPERSDGLNEEQVTGRAPTGEVAGPIPPLAGEAAKDAPDGRPSVN